MPYATWSTERLALLVLAAFVVSVCIGVVILASRPRSFGYAAITGLAAGFILRLTPGGQLAAEQASGWFVWIGQPIIGAGFALLMTAIFEMLLSPQVPLFRLVRPYGRRAMLPWRWGTSEEIAEAAGVPSWVPAMLGVSVEPRPLSAAQILVQVRIIASVFCGTCVGVFFAIPTFRHVLAESLGPEHILVNLIVAAFVTFLLGPLHEQVADLTETGHQAEAGQHTSSEQIRVRAGLFVVITLLLVFLQAVHSAVHRQVETLSLYEWILLLEVCALPVLVTTYYFGAALYRTELGASRWSRALEASVFGGTIALAPFTLVYFLTQSFPPEFRDSLLAGFGRPDRVYQLGVLVLVILLCTILIAIVTAVVISAATYGVYALALALAMSDAAPADLRRRTCLALLIAGAIVQGLNSLAVYWTGTDMPVPHYFHLAIAAGWAGGLYASRFHEQVVLPEPAPAA